MYTGLLHTHKLVVVVFLLIYFIKTTLLLFNKNNLFTLFSKKIKIVEMGVSALFLLTGLVMLFSMAKITAFQIIKIILVFSAIPLAVVGFKRMNKALALLSFLFIIAAYGLAEMSKKALISKEPIAENIITDINDKDYNIIAHGKAIYQIQCVICHGKKGNQKIAGAKDLTMSQKRESEIKKLLKNGKNSMPSYKKVFNEQEMEAITAYVLTLKKS